MSNDKTIYQLQAELDKVEKQLDNEKLKRTIIMIFFYSLAVAHFMFDKNKLDSILSLLAYLVICLLCGGFFYISTIIYVLVTNIFTNTNALEERVKYLNEEIKNIRNRH